MTRLDDALSDRALIFGALRSSALLLVSLTTAMTPLWKELAPWSVAPGTTAGHLTLIRIFMGFLWSQQFWSHRPPGDAPFFPAPCADIC